MINEWIAPAYQDGVALKNLLQKEPFSHAVLSDFLIEEKAVALFEALLLEEFIMKESDLFQLKQTQDLAGSKGILKSFRDFLASKPFVEWIQTVSDCSLKEGIVDLAGTLYEDTDFLLCHDDQLEGRKIAFLFYLSDMDENDGGSLNLFSSKNKAPDKIVKKITPKFNTFAFFVVSPTSFHEVEEIVVDKQRVALGGWMHGN